MVDLADQSIISLSLPVVGGDIALRNAVLAAIVYADLFDYPLTIDELTRYQVGTSYSAAEIAHCIRNDEELGKKILESDGYFSLRERPELVRIRRRREMFSRKLWRKALVYSRWASNLPFVRMVAVTGALAMHNVGPVPDIDLLVGAQEGRVWLCRRVLIMLVRVARLLGDDLCPNYIIAETNLELDQRDLYTAHELAQMVPMSGLPTYRRMLKANAWARQYLPRAFGPLALNTKPHGKRPLQIPPEGVLRQPVFDTWERWELHRLQAKLRPALGNAAEVVCSPVQCKGHTGLHRQTVLERYERRLGDVKHDE